MAKEEINFLKVRSTASGTLSRIERMLTVYTWWALGGLLTVGVIIGSIYLFVITRQKNLESRKGALLVAIREQTVKEGYLVSVKQRSQVAGKALSAAKPYGKLFPLLLTIAPENYFINLSVDEAGKSTVSLEVPSVDEAVMTVSNILLQVKEKQLRNPQMLSFYLKETGMVLLSFSFIANL